MASPASRSRLLALAAAVLLAGCQRPDVRPSPTRTYVHPGLGLSFELPADWTETAVGSAVVLGGPAGTPAYFTTITVQASPELALEPDVPGQLESVLAATVRILPSDDPPRLGPRRLLCIPSFTPPPLLALRYSLAFDLYEHKRLREGLLVRTATALVAIDYSAPAELFAESYLVFDGVVTSLLAFPPDGGQP